LGGEKGSGYPLTDEATPLGGRGRYNQFERGSIYWSPETGAHAVYGAIFAKWISPEVGGLEGFGFPLTDETGAPDNRGRYNHFENGSIFWTPTTDAHVVYGGIRAKWQALGSGWGPNSLGYPTTDEFDNPPGDLPGRVSQFERGFISWTSSNGAHEHRNGQPFVITLNDFVISTTRARHEDTDHASLTVKVGDQPEQTVIKHLGDVNDGFHSVGLELQINADDPRARIAINYLIVNTGHSNNQEVEDGLKVVARRAVEAGAAALCLPFGPIIGGAVAPLLAWAAGQLTDLGVKILFADCDGPVAMEADVISAATLNNLTATSPYGTRRYHAGTDTPTGCGDNSQYYVYWQMAGTYNSTYKIDVTTGNIDDAGTDANVYLILQGNGQTTNPMLLDTAGNDHERGQTGTYVMRTSDTDPIARIRIYHDNTGNKPGWFLEKIVVTRQETNVQWTFPCHRWLSLVDDDHLTDRWLNPV
jgi:hypothetical protein